MVGILVGTDMPFWGQPETLGSCSWYNQGTPPGCPGGVQRVALPIQSELAPLSFQVGSFCRAFWGSGTSVAGLGGGSEDHGRGQPPGDHTGQGAAPWGDTAFPAGMWVGTGWGDLLSSCDWATRDQTPPVPLRSLLTSLGSIVLCAATEVASLTSPPWKGHLTLPR